MNQTLAHYNELKNSASLMDDLGCTLPKLTSATLQVRNELCTAEQLAAKLAFWHNAQGWYQMSNSTALGAPASVINLLEGEWYDGKKSLSVQLLGPNHYQVTELEMREAASSDFCYQEQAIWLRENLCSNSQNTVYYRQWFQRKDYAWQAIVSQFVGFTFIKEQ